jgi:hypothetical protein
MPGKERGLPGPGIFIPGTHGGKIVHTRVRMIVQQSPVLLPLNLLTRIIFLPFTFHPMLIAVSGREMQTSSKGTEIVYILRLIPFRILRKLLLELHDRRNSDSPIY